VAPDSTVLVPAQTATLAATLRAADGSSLSGRTVTWTTGSASVATVSAAGEVVGVGAGITQVTASAEGRSGSATVVVREGAMIGAAGGTVTADGGNLEIVVPAGALTAATPISVTRMAAPPSAGALRGALAYDLGPNGTQFAAPVRLTIRHASTGVDSLLPLLRVVRFTNGSWVALPGGTANAANLTVTAETGSFSSYGLGFAVSMEPVVVSPAKLSIYVGQTASFTASVRINGSSVPGNVVGPFTVLPVTWTGDQGILVSGADRVASVTGQLHGDTEQSVGAIARIRAPCSAGFANHFLHPNKCYLGDINGTPVLSDAVQLNAVGSAKVMVLRVPVRSVQVTPGTAQVTAGQTLQLQAMARDSVGGPLADRTVAWTSGNVTKATVSSAGMVTALAPGTVTINATSEGVLGTATLTIVGSTAVVTSVQVTSPVSTIEVGATTQLTATARDNQGNVVTGRPVGWSSQNTAIATVSPTGLVTGIAAGGPVSIRATVDGIVGGVNLTVTTAVPLVRGIPAAGVDRFSCLLRDDGTTWCWGQGTSGQLGITTTPASQPVPTRLTTAPTFAALVGGGSVGLHSPPEQYHACGLTAGGEAWCWGANHVGQLGDGGTAQRNIPTMVTGGLHFAHLALAPAWRTCGVTTGGEAYCWGSSTYGHGNPAVSIRPVPTRIATSQLFSRIAAAQFVTCALTAAGAPWCWGPEADGEAGDGDGTNDTHDQPKQVVGGHVFTQLVAGATHFCGLKADGSAWCWGGNSQSPLGDGTTLRRSAPVAVATPVRFTALSAGLNATCGIATNQMVWCWGRREAAGGGLGSPSSFSTPVAVPLTQTFTAISVGGGHTCGTASDGIWCWGNNQWGQLGNGSTALVPLGPVKVVFPN